MMISAYDALEIELVALYYLKKYVGINYLREKCEKHNLNDVCDSFYVLSFVFF